MTNETNYVLILGSSNMDLNIYSKKFPKPGETVTGGEFKQYLGGKGANQAVASVRSGADTVFIGKIGTDPFGDQMITQLNDEGININYVIRDPQEPSGVAFILIDQNGENMISVAPGSNFRLNSKEIRSNAEIIRDAFVTVVQMEIPMETIQAIFAIASEGKSIKILNPAPFKPIPIELLKMVDIIIPNEGEIFKLHSLFGFQKSTGKGNQKIIEVSRDISSLGVPYIITTLGNKGCIIFDGNSDQIFKMPAPKVKAIDTVGAGDCFIGVFAGMLSKGETILNAVKIATVAASVAVTKKGAQASMPYFNEIQEKLKDLNLYDK
jgi:ribokinase